MPDVVEDDPRIRATLREHFESINSADEMSEIVRRSHEKGREGAVSWGPNDLPTPSVRITHVGKHSSLQFSREHDRTQVK